MKRVVHHGIMDTLPGGKVWWNAACGNRRYLWMRTLTGYVVASAEKVTCRACLAALPEGRAAALAKQLETAALDGPSILYDIAVRVTRAEVVKVRVPRGRHSLEQAERVAILTARGHGASAVHVVKTKVVDKRHPRK